MLRRIADRDQGIRRYLLLHRPGALLQPEIKSEFYARMWRMATPTSFDQAISLPAA
ncbi:hypothetical protein M8494_17795 [Serratia ureilytica]